MNAVHKLRDEVECLKRDRLHELYEQLTQPQKDMFHRLYPTGVPLNKIESALDLCDRTLDRNKAGRAA